MLHCQKRKSLESGVRFYGANKDITWFAERHLLPGNRRHPAVNVLTFSLICLVSVGIADDDYLKMPDIGLIYWSTANHQVHICGFEWDVLTTTG